MIMLAGLLFIKRHKINIVTASLSQDFLSFSFPDINNLDFNAKHGNIVKPIGCYFDYEYIFYFISSNNCVFHYRWLSISKTQECLKYYIPIYERLYLT